MRTPFFLHIVQHAVAFLYVWLCPFTKVEESFNLQAMHDIIHHKGNLSEYDHNEFPGVVPRTFIGPLIASLLSSPFMNIVSSKLAMQYVVRSVLAVLFLYGLKKFQDAVRKEFGMEVVKYLIIINLTQFHLLFYASRPLPNIFAMTFVLHALSAWMNGQTKKFIWFSAFVILTYRSELAIFLGLCLLVSFIKQKLGVISILSICIPAGITSLLITIIIDSWFWNRWLWPEGEVLYFNAILNKSSQWGTSPFLWYFYSALPRLLLSAYIFLPFSIHYFPKRSATLAFPALGYVLLYSFLPHKELRFIIYTVPIFNTLAACVYARLSQQKGKSMFKMFLYLLAIGLLVVNILATFLFAGASFKNYPGGHGLREVHDLILCEDGDLHIHIDNYAAQTGVSRFGQLCDNWIYDKTENIDEDLDKMSKFSHLIIESSTQNYVNFINGGTHKIMSVMNGYSGYTLNYVSLEGLPFRIPYPSIKSTPRLFILERIR